MLSIFLAAIISAIDPATQKESVVFLPIQQYSSVEACAKAKKGASALRPDVDFVCIQKVGSENYL